MEFEIKTDETITKEGGVKEKKVIRMGLVEFIVFFVLLLMLFLLAASMGIREYYRVEYAQLNSKVVEEESKTIDYAEALPDFIDELRFDTDDDDVNNIMNLALVNTLKSNKLEIDGTWKKISTGTTTRKAVDVGLKTGDVVEAQDGEVVQYRIYDGDEYKILDANQNEVDEESENMMEDDNFIKNEFELCNLYMLTIPEAYQIVVESSGNDYVVTGVSETYKATEEYTISKATNKLVKATVKNGAVDVSCEVNF